jgi:type I restriction enzyme M protein
LPQETFFSSGASVKASLLFMQKFTQKEQVDFDKKVAAARIEIEAKHAPTIAKEKARFQEAIAIAEGAEKRKALQKQLADYEKLMSDTVADESRRLLKQRFPYFIFLYEAQKVGITATGDADQNELVPNDNQPRDLDKTCLELYREFRKDPKLILSP